MARNEFQGTRPRWQYTVLGLALGLVVIVAVRLFARGLVGAAVLAIAAATSFTFAIVYERRARRAKRSS